MKFVDCILKLAEDPDYSSQDRTVDLSVAMDSGSRFRGPWTMLRDARDPRMVIGAKAGEWLLHDRGDHPGWTMTFIPLKDTKVLLDFYNVGSDPFDQVDCSHGIAGEGWHQGPPNSSINYKLSFVCS